MLWVPSVVVPFDPSLSLSAVLIMYDVAPVCYQHDIEGSDGAKRSSCSSFSLPPSADRPLLLSAALLNRSPLLLYIAQFPWLAKFFPSAFVCACALSGIISVDGSAPIAPDGEKRRIRAVEKRSRPFLSLRCPATVCYHSL